MLFVILHAPVLVTQAAQVTVIETDCNAFLEAAHVNKETQAS